MSVLDALLAVPPAKRRALLTQRLEAIPALLTAVREEMTALAEEMDAATASPNPSNVLPWRESTRESDAGEVRNPAAIHASPADRASANTFRGVCYLPACDGWTGPERPTRNAAHDDAVRHIWGVNGGHHLDVLTADGTPARLRGEG